MVRKLVTMTLALLVATGCTTTRKTQPPRTATEQRLISTAADQAIPKLWVDALDSTSVFLVTEHFESLDEDYVISAVKAHLLQQGAFVVKDRSEAQLIVEIRSGALSIDKSEHLFLGIPSIPLPIPFAGEFEIPEIPLFKREHQQGIAKFALTAYNPRTGVLKGHTGPVYGESYLTHWRFFLIPWTQTNLPSL